jgi:hypothetical protein
MDRTVPTRRGLAPGGQLWDKFDFSEFEPPRIVLCGPCGTVNRPDPWIARIWTEPVRNVCKTIGNVDFIHNTGQIKRHNDVGKKFIIPDDARTMIIEVQ